MSVCPGCQTEVANPTKTWAMVGKPSKKGERFKLTLGIFNCPQCGRKFRKVVGKDKERVTFKGMIEEIKGIERGLVQTLGNFKEKIEKLKDEKAELLDQIEKLKKAGEKKARALEKEIASLKKEAKEFKKMLSDFE